MFDLGHEIHEKMKHIENILSKVENGELVSVVSVLQEEIKTLRNLTEEYKTIIEGKKVMKQEESGTKTRYYLKDGSVYVVKGKEYRYLYDTKTKIVTYQFENGQIERTFENGLKEIRQPDGSITIKSGVKEYDRVI